MGTWSAAILGNDTACEVRDSFFALYDAGEVAENITAIILKEQKDNLEYDRTNVWLGLAMACWECGLLTKVIFKEVKKIVDTKEDIKFSKSLNADEIFLKKRQKILDSFIDKIATGKLKPRPRKKAAIQAASIYEAGMCMAYKNSKGKYIGIYLTASEHFKNKGKIEFFFLDFESNKLPALEMFKNAKLYGLKKLGKIWGNYEYRGNITDLCYDKNTKAAFWDHCKKIFTIIGKLKKPDLNRLTNNYNSDYMYSYDTSKMIDSMESVRLEGKLEHKLSGITLNQLLDKIAQQ